MSWERWGERHREGRRSLSRDLLPMVNVLSWNGGGEGLLGVIAVVDSVMVVGVGVAAAVGGVEEPAAEKPWIVASSILIE